MAKTRRRKRRTHVNADHAPGTSKSETPKTFVFRRGRLAESVKELSEDLRKVMEPHTARNLKETKANKLKDFVQVSGPLGISHFLMLSSSDANKYLKICRTPRGPTLTFKIHAYSLANEVAKAQKKPRNQANAFLSPPLVVLNNFGDEAHQKLATITFQNMFPPINVRRVKLSTCQRAVLVDYDAKTKRFLFRHYSINAAPVGTNKKLKKLLTSRNAPDMGDMQDVSEFFDKRVGDASDSELSDDESRRVTLAQDFNRVAHADSESKIILQEIGPRMELELVKVEEGMCDGRVLYHAYVKKSADEIKTLEQKKTEREKLRKQRRLEQETNVKRKARDKEMKADAERQRQGKSKKKPSNQDEYKNEYDREAEEADERKWQEAFKKEEKEWQEGDTYEAPKKRRRPSREA